MKVTFKIEGLKELEKQLNAVSKSVGKAALRKSLKKAAEPLRDKAIDLAPKDSGDLKESMTISNKLNRSQKKLHKKSEGKASVEMFVGPTTEKAPYGVWQEFGTSDTAPQPFMRPAFQATQQEVVDMLGDELAKNISAAVKRAEKRAAKKGGE